MPASRPITIVGGGLAGLTLGIGLRRENVPVLLWEARHYPRHRVCGEFICGQGHSILQQLGLLRRFEDNGAYWAQTAQFIAAPNRSPVRQLSVPALCLSREKMDALLASEFTRLGGELRENSRWNGSEMEGLVHASGRRPRTSERGWRWFGLKAHARSVDLAADLEMHVSAAGYIGINRVNDSIVNVCGLFRSRPGTPVESGLELLRGPRGSSRHERLANAVFDESSICSVAGLSLQPERASNSAACRIGDALTMIPPVTGNGMSMAFESAAICIAPLAAYSRGRMSWSEAQQTIAQACDAQFKRRLAWARLLQALMFSRILRTPAGALLLKSHWLWEMLFSRTR
jgi:menaquinone-9 beta-reductase